MICDIEKKYGPCEIRRPSKKADNQYTLIKTESRMFFALFKDGEGKAQETEITEAVYLELLQETREDDARLRWENRHLDDSADISTLTDRSADSYRRSVEDAVIADVLMDEESPVRSAVSVLQWRRLRMRYELGLTIKEIASLEGCTKMPIKRSIEDAVKKIKKNLK